MVARSNPGFLSSQLGAETRVAALSAIEILSPVAYRAEFLGKRCQEYITQTGGLLTSVSNTPDLTRVNKIIRTRWADCEMPSNNMDLTHHILIVDDDSEIRALLSDSLTRSGYRVSTSPNGAAMMQTLSTTRIDLIVLDIMMPGEDGLSICRRLRAAGPMPIIMLTSLAAEVDRIVGLEMGADDYLPKPFATRELLARIRAVLRRTALSPAGSGIDGKRIFEFAGWRLDATKRKLYSPANVLVDLRTAEFDLLLALVERPDHVLTRDQLLDLARGRTHPHSTAVSTFTSTDCGIEWRSTRRIPNSSRQYEVGAINSRHQ